MNGVLHSDDPKHELHDLGNNSSLRGIFPGRCGDTSPHEGAFSSVHVIA